jgi:hypothetical protein
MRGKLKNSYQVTTTNKSAALEILEDNGGINKAWDTIAENIRISAEENVHYCESKHHKTWFHEECLKLVDQRKQAKLQWLQDPSEENEDNLSDVWQQASRHFGNNKREYLKEKN